jgi:UDP-N-acetylmuramoylalanine--D-glutamate ligase
MNQADFKGKKITVMGLGTLGGGVGVVKYLAKKKAKVLVTDVRKRSELTDSINKIGAKNVKYVLGRHRLKDFKNTDLVIKNPAVPNGSKYIIYAKKNGIPVESDASLFFQLCKNPIIGVTGTKGKTTTVALLKSILKSAGKEVVLVGHNRVSVLDRLNVISKKSIVIFELSSWRLEILSEHKLSPHVAVMTNIAQDHLNTYRNMGEYIKAKSNIFAFQHMDDFVILNKDNQYTAKLGKKVVARRYWFSRKFFPDQNGIFVRSGRIFFRNAGQESQIMNIKTLRLRGKHNLDNVMAAVSAAKLLKIPNKAIVNALSNFGGLKDRMEFVKDLHGKRYYNDTAATIPEATIAALNSFDKKVILIAGGVDKKVSYQALAKAIKNKAEYVVLLPGSGTNKLKSQLNRDNVGYVEVADLRSAVQHADKYKGKSKDVVFSPGAASFNLFKNEFDRGDKFRKIVTSFK